MSQQPLAYLDPEFLESDEGRPIRIISEYLEPLAALQGTEDPGHGGVLRIGAGGQPRARGAGAADPARARRRGRRRALRGRAEAQPQGGRVGALLRGRARAGAAADRRGRRSLQSEQPPLRRHLRRRAGDHGSGQPRRARRRRQDHRPEHPPAVRAGRQSVHHRRAALRVPLLLHAQVLVRVSGEGAGGLPGRLRHARRAVRDPHAGADRQAVEEDRRRPLRPRVLGAGARPEADGRVGRDRREGSRAAALRRHAGRGVRVSARSPDRAIISSRRTSRKRRRPRSPRRGASAAPPGPAPSTPSRSPTR